MNFLKYVMKEFLDKGCDEVILNLSKTDAVQIKFANSKIAKTGIEVGEDLSIYITKDKKRVVTILKELDKKSADRMVKEAMRYLKSIHPKEDYNGINEKKFKYSKTEEGYDKNIIGIGDKAVDIVEEAINIANQNKINRTAGILECYIVNEKLLTSNGIEVEDKSTRVYFSLRALLSKHESGHKVGSSRILKKLDFKKITEEACHIAQLSENPGKAVFGKMDVVLEPLVVADLMEHVGDATSIFSVESGFSFFKDKLDKKVGSSKLTLVDDGTLKNGYNSTPFDSEGVRTEKNTLIKDGKLKTYLYNTSTAKKYNVKGTGNAGIISPDPWNLVVKPGELSNDDLIKKVKRGLWITHVWYTRFQNYTAGNFSTIPRDGIFYIENGKIKKPIRGIRISENILNMLKNIEEVGNNVEQITSWEISTPVITPSMLIKNVNITKPLDFAPKSGI